MSYFTRPMDLPERRSALVGVVQLVILAVLIGTVPIVGGVAAFIWLVLHYNARQAKQKKLADLRTEYYPWGPMTRAFYSPNRPPCADKGDVWYDAAAQKLLIHDGEDFR